MVSKKAFFIILVAIVTIIVGISSMGLLMKEEEFQLVPKEMHVRKDVEAQGTEVGTGWSAREIPEEAAKEAIDMALAGKRNLTPDFAIIFASSGSDMKAIFSEARRLLGSETKMFGGTSDARAVMTNKGFVKAEEETYDSVSMEGKRALAVMTISSADIKFGVGSVRFSDYPSVREASKAVILNAIKNAGRSQDEKPRVVLTTPTFGVAEEALEAIEEVLGNETVILGGTSGGPKFAVFGEKEIYEEGLSLAVIYTDLPVGWVFEGGFDVTDVNTGVVTKVDGYAILEIDHKPALDVYDGWLGGKIHQLFEEVKDPRLIKDQLTLHPFYRKYTMPNGQDYFLFSHPMARDETLQDKTITTSTKISVGERIHLSHGTWETLINRIGNLVTKAKVQGEIDIDKRPILGIGYICAGVMGIIPKEEREKMPFLIAYANGGAPFIVNFSWGEQGHFPGIGNKHGNLLTSFIVIGSKE